jgi:type II restriction/modification system DNA methylase subunit YeeA
MATGRTCVPLPISSEASKDGHDEMTPDAFITKWRNGGDERRDAQPFFEDLCRLVGHPTPREADPEHKWFTYEYGATKTSGGNGWADVWKKGYFGWEAKGTHKSLSKAYEQLKMYADALENPPLLVVSDLQTIIVHTNFTNTAKQEYEFNIDQLSDYKTRQILEAVFNDPSALRPGLTRTMITQDAAEKFTALAKALRDRGHDPHPVAHFLNRLLFCMFAEDIGLLPNQLFTKMVNSSQDNPGVFEKRCGELFAAMHKGGDVAFENIDWFNGGLFDDGATLHLEAGELKILLDACRLDWSEIEPSIFGTLFERGLDPSKRSQLGAHYTDPVTILKIVRPLIIEPWLLEWEAEKAALASLLAKAKKSIPKPAQDRFARFLERLRAFRVLDPACGSGNFLYLALRALKDIEKRVLIEGEALGLGRQFPALGPRSVMGIELNEYAAELARITVWIGEIQWMVQNGYGANRNPILQPLDQIENRDALLNPDGSEAVWPQAHAIVGNPPFLGGSVMRGELGSAYVDAVRKAYVGRVPGFADFVCFWFEKANDAIRAGKAQRAGLVATNSIRGGANSEVLKHAAESTRIFEAWSDEPWTNEGAAVRVSLVCFGHSDQGAQLDGKPVAEIYSDLIGRNQGAAAFDLTLAKPLKENAGAWAYGSQEKGDFAVPVALALSMLVSPNPNEKPNSDVIRRSVNAKQIAQRRTSTWLIDFGLSMSEADACLYEKPFEVVKEQVAPARLAGNDKGQAKRWWLHARPSPKYREAMKRFSRLIVSPCVSKHRLFVFLSPNELADHGLAVIARDDDTTLGVLHSRFHELWSLRMCTWLGVGNDPRYTPTTCFETFPFPEGLAPDTPAATYANDPRAMRVAEVSRAMVEARDRWLNPAEWVERVPEVVPNYPDRIIAKPGHEADLKKRTLTNLYNARPAWLQNLHADLDAAVAAAYGWPWPLSDDEILRRLFELNQIRTKNSDARPPALATPLTSVRSPIKVR